jgi:hypothetical protein
MPGPMGAVGITAKLKVEKMSEFSKLLQAEPAKESTGKAMAKAPLTGEVLAPSELPDFIHEIENLTEAEAKLLVDKLAEGAEFTFFQLGGVLSVIHNNGWFKPYASFKEYVEHEHGIKFRRAMHWIAIYKALAENKVPWEKVKQLGWTKLSVIAQLLTPENVDEWVSIAEDQTVLQLKETVRSTKSADVPKALEDQASKTVTTKFFKVHEDQRATIEAALAKAKEESGTPYDTVAMEYICMD